MLELIRTKAQGWLAWTIVILLIIPFALWGINKYINKDTDTYVASVGGVDISKRVYDQAYQNARARLQQSLGKNFDPAMLERFGLKQSVVNGLIEDEVLTQAATRAGYRVSDEQLAQEIRGLENFQVDGKFDPERYQRLLRAQGDTPGSFEARVGRLMLINQLRGGINESSFITKTELRDMVRLRDQQREISYLIIPATRFSKEINVDDAAIETYYANNSESFAIPEKVSVDYVELAVSDLVQSVPVDEQKLQQLYRERSAEFAGEEQRRASHILVQFGDDPAAARAKAEELLQRVKNGESFEQLAKKYSDDPGSSGNGGDLGFFGRNIMDKAFEDATFALAKVGDVSDVVESSFGFHIIKLTGIQPGRVKSFEEVRDQLAADYRRRQAEEMFFDRSEILANAAFEHPESLSVAAESIGLEIKKSDFFSRASGRDIASHAAVRQAAFSDEVLKGGNNSESIEISPEDIVVLRINQHEPSTTRPLEDVRDQIVERLRNERARERARELGEKLLTDLKAGGDDAQMASEQKLSWTKAQFVGRKEKEVNAAIIDNAFRLQKPTDDKPVYSGTVLSNGNYAVIHLSVVKDGDVAALDAADLRKLRETMKQTRGSGEQRLLVNGLVSRADIVRHKTEEL